MMHYIETLTRRACSIPKRLKAKCYLKVILPRLVSETKKGKLPISELDFFSMREATLSYVDCNRTKGSNIGSYSYKIGGPALLYSSCYAALIRHLYQDLNSLSKAEKSEWIAYIQSYQCDDGIFRDNLINCPTAEACDWWGWRHLTLHALMALTALGGVARKSFNIITKFRNRREIITWLETRDWKDNPAHVSNQVQNYGTFLQYARDYHAEYWCNESLDVLYDWLDKHQDPKTGLWGEAFDTPSLLSNGVQTGYHIWLLYFYDLRRIQYIHSIIDSCLATQNRFGGFGVPLNSSACEDIDSIDPLIRLSYFTTYRQHDVKHALQEAVQWILANMNKDGGFVFRRGDSLKYGHDNMYSKSDQSAMFPTWFRTLSLAYLSQLLPDKIGSGTNWQFISCPGHQFLNKNEASKNKQQDVIRYECL